ncbi:hypothetical protein D3C81_1997070 [compost metagenome]
MDIRESTWQQICIASFDDADFAQHLLDHNFNVLIIDFYALVTIYALNFLQDIVLNAANTFDTQYFFRVN